MGSNCSNTSIKKKWANNNGHKMVFHMVLLMSTRFQMTVTPSDINYTIQKKTHDFTQKKLWFS